MKEIKLDEQKLQEMTQQYAMQGAEKAIKDFYTGYDEPELPFKPGDEVRLVNQADADMDGRRAVVERAYRNSRTSKIDVEIRFDDEQDATYMYNDSDLAKEG